MNNPYAESSEMLGVRMQNITFNAESEFECRKDHICWIEYLIQKITGVDATYVSRQESHRNDWKWIGSTTPTVPGGGGVGKLQRIRSRIQDLFFSRFHRFLIISPTIQTNISQYAVKKTNRDSRCTLTGNKRSSVLWWLNKSFTL